MEAIEFKKSFSKVANPCSFKQVQFMLDLEQKTESEILLNKSQMMKYVSVETASEIIYLMQSGKKIKLS